jgi:phage tail protein X
MIEYMTEQGDTFDTIALDFYEDEFKASALIAANPQYAGTIFFEAGITLNIPAIEEDIPSTLPPWRH